jgi:hypothetical protein
MSSLATPLLLGFLALTALLTAYAAVNAASVPFAIHMVIMAVWAAGFFLWSLKRRSHKL